MSRKRWVAVQHYQDESWDALVALWQHYNRHLLHVMARVPGDQLSRRCVIGDNDPVTLEFLMKDYVVHLKHHLDKFWDRRPSVYPETVWQRGTSMEKVNLSSKTAALSRALETQDRWRAERTDGEAGQVSGPFVWHHHEQEDEMFLVIKGRFRMEFRDRQVWLEEGEFLIVPRGVEHRPVAEEEAHVLLFEPPLCSTLAM